jgi:ElaB/YqjD/DUF883 family membrane-anchored ribosome-binding protein
MVMVKKNVDQAQNSKIASLRAEYENLKDRMADYEAQFEDKIKEHPIASVSTAFGVGAAVGVVLGYLLSKK